MRCLPQAAAGGRMNVVLKSSASSLLVRDALRRPLAELELGEVSAGLSRSSPAVMQVKHSGDGAWKALQRALSTLHAGASWGWAGQGGSCRSVHASMRVQECKRH